MEQLTAQHVKPAYVVYAKICVHVNWSPIILRTTGSGSNANVRCADVGVKESADTDTDVYTSNLPDLCCWQERELMKVMWYMMLWVPGCSSGQLQHAYKARRMGQWVSRSEILKCWLRDRVVGLIYRWHLTLATTPGTTAVEVVWATRVCFIVSA